MAKLAGHKHNRSVQYGERDCTVEDVAGHRWQFAETVRDVAPEDYGCTTVAPWPGRPGA